MRKGTFTSRRLGLLALITILGACATQKSRYDQSKVAKLYHDVTAEFNGYFNAKEILAQSMLELEAQYEENYTDILEIYPYRAAPNPEAVAANLDEAIKKVSVVATLHESSKWVDDCYLLIGKSFYLKQDFESAENALEFYLDEFNADGTRIVKKKRKKKARASKQSVARKKAQSEKERKRLAKEQERERKRYNKELRKKKKQSNRGGGKKTEEAPTQRKTARGTEEPSPLSLEEQQRGKAEPLEDPNAGDENPGGLKHRPAYQEGQMWLAKTYVERENYPGVERLLNGLEGNPNLQEEVRDELPLVWAYYMLHRENYAGAIPHLQKGVEFAKKRVDKARLSFILGQIAERDENYTVAAEYYEKALQSNHDYALNFNARLSLARAQLQAGTMSLDEVSAMIEKMLKDSKNVEYQDQLYFAMARLALHRNDVPLAIEYLQLAAQVSAGNQTQLTETNYLLATLYYESGDYINAKAAYDATLATMAKSDDRYRQVDRLSKNLTDIAMHLQTIELQDSLIRLSYMSDAERRILAKAILQPEPQQTTDNTGKVVPVALKGGAGIKMADSKGDALNDDTKRPSSPSAGLSAMNSNFFAYDQRKLKKEFRDFEGRWGDRPLVDNWRVSSLAGPGGFAEDEEETQSAPTNILTDEQIDRLFSSVPDTDEKKAQANEAIQNAMLQLGSLYRDKLEDYKLSIEMLEDLLNKYPDTKYRLDAYYQLYLSHLSLGQQAQADVYKNKIITEFAASKYALVLTDPDYLSKQLSEEEKLDRDYQEVYALVNKGDYEEAQSRIINTKASFGTNHALQPKYSILEAMCIGNLQGREAYVDALKGVIGAYPGTPEEIKARDMLLLLDEYQGSRLNLSKGSSAPSYKAAMDAQHFILIQVNGMPNSDAQDVKVSISNYNRKYHNLDKLKISSLRFDTKGDQVIILVRSFKDGAAALKYLNGIQKYPDEFAPSGVNYEAFAVTQNNYREIVKQKSVDSYRDFYAQNYQ